MLTRSFLDERLVPELEYGTIQYFDHMRRYLFAQQFVQGKRVLDIATGTGYGSDILNRGGAAQVFGIDLDIQALKYAARKWQAAQLLQADAAAIPFGDRSIDVVVSYETSNTCRESARLSERTQAHITT